MKSVGLIVEYNPYHNGHKYHATQAKKVTGAEVVVAVMSGNWLQRGEPAIVDKWQRTEMALSSGVDLMIELPFAYSVQSADYFARGGVKLLQALDVDSLVFGTDRKEKLDYEEFGRLTVLQEETINQKFHELKNKNLSYPARMTKVYRTLFPEWTLDFSSPNHILGMAYAKENARYTHPMELKSIPRISAQYHEKNVGGTIASATAIREYLLHEEREVIHEVVPSATFDILNKNPLVDWENYWQFLNYQLLSSTPEKLATIYQMSEGFEYRLLEQVRQADNFQAFMEKIKTKRYTWTRIERLLTYVLIQVSPQDILESWENTSIHVLGFTQKGQQFLKEKKKKISLPVVSKIGRNEKSTGLTQRADEIYQLGAGGISEQNFGRIPIRK
ncbi:MAG: nucleotidyltransferase [Lactobacillales bacterium]|jgi:predicted nucleotidyltransferase|nr:nucleotidyltransferase [Lactobacillales bacterium]